MRAAVFLVLLFSLSSCLDQPKEEEQPVETPIIDNLPINDRDLLLEPLESAYDDLKSAIEVDEGFFMGEDEASQGDVLYKTAYKLYGPDTMMVEVEISGKTNLSERHKWYFNQKGNLFYSFHEITNADFGFEEGPMHRQHKFYFEDNGAQLSAYGRVSFDGAPLPEQWTPVCLTSEEEKHLQGRLRDTRKLVGEKMKE